jgi:hypothetical protein
MPLMKSLVLDSDFILLLKSKLNQNQLTLSKRNLITKKEYERNLHFIHTLIL